MKHWNINGLSLIVLEIYWKHREFSLWVILRNRLRCWRAGRLNDWRILDSKRLAVEEELKLEPQELYLIYVTIVTHPWKHEGFVVATNRHLTITFWMLIFDKLNLYGYFSILHQKIVDYIVIFTSVWRKVTSTLYRTWRSVYTLIWSGDFRFAVQNSSRSRTNHM